MHTVSQGDWDDAIIRGHVESLQTKSGYVLCPGLPNYTAEFGEHIRYTPKNLRVWSIPFHRHDHHLCALWHKPSNRKQSPSSPLFNACSTCKSLYSNLQTTRKNEMGVSPASKMKRLEPSSTYPLDYLSPQSQSVRVSKAIEERHEALRKLRQRIKQTCELELEEEQHNELERLVYAISTSKVGKAHLSEIVCEANSQVAGSGDVLSEVWDRDTQNRIAFYKDQVRNTG